MSQHFRQRNELNEQLQRLPGFSIPSWCKRNNFFASILWRRRTFKVATGPTTKQFHSAIVLHSFYGFLSVFNWNSQSLMWHKFLWSITEHCVVRRMFAGHFFSRPTLKTFINVAGEHKKVCNKKVSCKFYCNSVRLKKGDLCLAFITQIFWQKILCSPFLGRERRCNILKYICTFIARDARERLIFTMQKLKFFINHVWRKW